MSIFKDKTTMEEALAYWPERSQMSSNEPQARDRPLPGQRANPVLAVQNVIRPRKGHGY